MKSETVKKIKDELQNRSSQDLVEFCLHLSKFKKENKELLSYLLFEVHNEDMYIKNVKNYIDNLFENINSKNFYYIRKSMRKILSITKKYIRYSKIKDTEVQLLLHFCFHLKEFTPSISNSTRLQNIYERQILVIKKAIDTLHEDLQYDYKLELEELFNG